jgi:CRISPR-associated endonuclease Cas1
MNIDRISARENTRQTVEIVDGYGCKISVSNSHLVLKNGDFGSADGWERWIARGRCNLERLIILSHEGVLTLDAIDWLNQLEVAIIVLDRTGNLVFCSAPDVRHDAELQRTQAVAGLSDRAIDIAQWIVAAKLKMQSTQLLSLIDSLPNHFGSVGEAKRLRESAADISALCDRFPETLGSLLTAEGRGAQIYFKALEGHAIPWVRQSGRRIPSHWLSIQPRASGVDGLSKDARDPYNAATNFVYSALAAECKIAAACVGLSEVFGFLHCDEIQQRRNFIYDLMEPIRPVADDLVLSFFFKWRERDSPIKSANFIELRNGVCRLAPGFARDLLRFVAAPLRARAREFAEEFARKLRSGAIYSLKLDKERRVRFAVTAPQPRNTECDYCGGPMRGQGKRFCGRSCFLRWSVEINRPVEKAHAKLAQLRADGRDPSHGSEAARKRGASNRKALAKTWAWRRSDAGKVEARSTRARQAKQRRNSLKSGEAVVRAIADERDA